MSDDDPRPGYVAGSETSFMAADDHATRRVVVAWNIWEAHHERSGLGYTPRGMTANEACKLFNDVSLNTVSARVTDLCQANCLLLTGERRRTDKKKWAEVHVVNPNASQDFFRWWIKERNRLFKLLKPAEAAHKEAREAYADAVFDGAPDSEVSSLLLVMINSAQSLRRVERQYESFILTQGCPGGIPKEPGDPPPFKEVGAPTPPPPSEPEDSDAPSSEWEDL
jgi:hypothetical protein